MDPASIRQEACALLQAYDRRPEHPLHVARLAVQLFDELAPLHGLGLQHRQWLEAAALLHDLGRATRGPGAEHHKESAQLIRQHAWQSLAPAEVEIVALVARYHRKRPPDLSHTEFALLAPADQAVVTTLAALLRIADGLDRTHRQLINGLRAEIAPHLVTLHLIGSPDALDELVAARRKAALAEKVFDRPFRFLLAPPGVSEPAPGQGPGTPMPPCS